MWSASSSTDRTSSSSRFASGGSSNSRIRAPGRRFPEIRGVGARGISRATPEQRAAIPAEFRHTEDKGRSATRAQRGRSRKVGQSEAKALLELGHLLASALKSCLASGHLGRRETAEQTPLTPASEHAPSTQRDRGIFVKET